MFNLTNRDYAHFFFDDYDLEAQLFAIRGFLSRAHATEEEEGREIKRLAQRAEAIGSEHLVGMYTDSLHASVYNGAAHSAAAVGMLAPFVENLATGIFRGIGREAGSRLRETCTSTRAQLEPHQFWDPHLIYTGGETRTNLVAGIMQLAGIVGLTTRLPADTRKILEAVFEYHNAMLHNGFEWPLERRAAFKKRVEQWDPTWFLTAQSGGQPWVWYMSDLFIRRVLDFIDEVFEAAGQYLKDNPPSV